MLRQSTLQPNWLGHMSYQCAGVLNSRYTWHRATTGNLLIHLSLYNFPNVQHCCHYFLFQLIYQPLKTLLNMSQDKHHKCEWNLHRQIAVYVSSTTIYYLLQYGM